MAVVWFPYHFRMVSVWKEYENSMRRVWGQYQLSMGKVWELYSCGISEVSGQYQTSMERSVLVAFFAHVFLAGTIAPPRHVRMNLHRRIYGLTSFLLFHPLQQMLTHSQCIGNNRKGWVYRSAGWEKRSINYIEVVCIMGFAIDIKHGSFRIIAKPAGAALVRQPFKRDIFFQV